MAVERAFSFVPDLAGMVRPGSAWCFDATGSLAEVPANELRHDFDPATGAYRGVLVERGSTNMVLRNRTTGAALGVLGSGGALPSGWSSTGDAGIVPEVVAIGTEAGMPFVDVKLAGTAQGTFRTIVFGNVSGYVTGTTYALSCWMKVVGGSLTGATVLTLSARYNLSPSGSTDISTDHRAALLANISNPTPQRYVTKGTATGALLGTGLVFVQVNWNPGATINVTLRFCLPQLEALGAPTSAILTDGATSTRAADMLTMTGIGRWFRPSAGTFVLEFTPRDAASSGMRGLIAIDDDTVSGNRIDVSLRDIDTGVRLSAASGGVTLVSALDAGAANVLARNTLRFSYGPAGYWMSLNGAAPSSGAAAVPANLTHVRLGSRHIGAPGQELNGWLGPRLAYYPKQYTDTPDGDGFTIRTR